MRHAVARSVIISRSGWVIVGAAMAERQDRVTIAGLALKIQEEDVAGCVFCAVVCQDFGMCLLGR